MGYFSDLQIELHEQEFKLADILDITIDELEELIYEIETDSSKDGLIYNYRVEFDIDNSNPDILDKVKNLSDGCRVYIQPYDFDDEFYYDDEFEAILESENHLQKFEDEISSLLSLLTIDPKDQRLKKILNRQIFVSAIGTMEAFLSEVFIIKVFDNRDYLKNFVNSHNFFKQAKFELKDIFKKYDQIEEIAKKVILDTIFHNLPTVSKMYGLTFGIDFPSIANMYKNVMLRHDLVHRNGKKKDGVFVTIEDADILKLIEELKLFIRAISKLLNL